MHCFMHETLPRPSAANKSAWSKQHGHLYMLLTAANEVDNTQPDTAHRILQQLQKQHTSWRSNANRNRATVTSAHVSDETV